MSTPTTNNPVSNLTELTTVLADIFNNSTNTNSTESSETDNLTAFFDNPRVPALTGLVVVSLVGNSLAMYKILFGLERPQGPRLMHRKSSAVFLNLVVADVLVTLFSMAGQGLWEYYGWKGPTAVCKLFKFMQGFSLTSSNYMLVTIALERHRAVTNPFRHDSSSFKMMFLTWLCALIPNLPTLFIFNISQIDPESPQLNCESGINDWDHVWKKTYFLGMGAFIFLIPLTILVGVYSHILYCLRKETIRQRLNQSSEQLDSATPDEREPMTPQFSFKRSKSVRSNNAPVQAEYFRSEERRQFYSRAMIKTTLLSITIVAVFLITNVPFMIHEFFLYGMLNVKTLKWCTESWCMLMKGIFGISITSNSAINPFIFLLFHSGNSQLDGCTSRLFPYSTALSDRVRGFRVQFSMIRRNQDSNRSQSNRSQLSSQRSNNASAQTPE